MAMRPRRVASSWFLHDFEKFNDLKRCPCCWEHYAGWGMFAYGFFKTRVCDDCYANVITLRLKDQQERNELEMKYQLRIQQVKQFQSTGKFTPLVK